MTFKFVLRNGYWACNWNKHIFQNVIVFQIWRSWKNLKQFFSLQYVLHLTDRWDSFRFIQIHSDSFRFIQIHSWMPRFLEISHTCKKKWQRKLNKKNNDISNFWHDFDVTYVKRSQSFMKVWIDNSWYDSMLGLKMQTYYENLCDLCIIPPN